MKIQIEIPNKYESEWYKDRFEETLHRLSADAHLIAGNYEQETARMLRDAFKDAEPIYPKPICDVCEDLEDGDSLHKTVDFDWGIGYEVIWDIHYCPRCGRKL